MSRERSREHELAQMKEMQCHIARRERIAREEADTAREVMQEQMAASRKSSAEQEQARRRDRQTLDAERDRVVDAREEVERLKFEAEGQRRKNERQLSIERQELLELKEELLRAAKGAREAGRESAKDDEEHGDRGAGAGDKKPEAKEAPGLEIILEALAAAQAQSQLALVEMRRRGIASQRQLVDSMVEDRALQRHRLEEDALAQKEMRETSLRLQEQQLQSQEDAQRVMLRIGNATSDNSARIKTEVPKMTAKDAVTFFFEIIEFEIAMDELHVGGSEWGIRWRSFRSRAEGSAKGILDGACAMPRNQKLIANDTNDSYREIFLAVWELMRQRMGLTKQIEKQLARK